MDSTGPTGSTEQTQSAAPTGETGVSYFDVPMAPYTEPLPDVLSIDDLVSETEVLVAKETKDGDAIRAIGLQSTASLKPKLVEWVTKGKPNAYPIIEVPIEPPSQCSDGVTRNLPEYIEFCSGQSIGDHMTLLQAKLRGMVLSFMRVAQGVAIVVSQS